MYDANPGGYPGRDGAVVVGLEQAYYEVGMFLILIHVTMMHICMMHLSMILDPDTYMYDAYINVSRSLTLMHVCMMHISMIM